jgi:aryl-alcohol dehydrogenase-like predicted oxidoreductase
MEQRNLGKSGLRVSLVGLGCNNFGVRIDQTATRAVVHKALDAGITLFDTADVYGDQRSEGFLAEALGERRKDIVLATKFGMPMDKAGRLKGGSRRYIMSAVEASLTRLKTDWIDLYQYHRPDGTPLDETLRALDDLVRQGKVRYIGCSNLPAWQVVESQWLSRSGGVARFISCQDEYSLLHRAPERDLLPAMEAHGIGLLPYYPLAGGLLTGKHRRDGSTFAGTRFANTPMAKDMFIKEANWAKVEALQRFADQRGHSLLELAMSWLAAKPVVSSVIAGATKPEQIEANVKAVSWAMSADDLAAIDALLA